MQNIFHIFAGPPSGCEHGFLTLVTWYHYLPDSEFGHGVSKCDLNTTFNFFPKNGHSDIGLILAAVIDDLLRIAGILALAFVIVGAIKFIASQGNPDATSSARGTIINALIGLALSITGIVIINFIGRSLGK